MKSCSVHTVKLLDEERDLLTMLAGKRDATYSDLLRMGLYYLAVVEGLDAQLTKAVHARRDHLLHVVDVWQGVRSEHTASVSSRGAQ
jgi:hypothetical protein